MTELNASFAHSSEPQRSSGGKGDKETVKRQYKPLLAMLILFSLPYFISWYYLFSDDPIVEVGSNNKGLLVSPMRQVDDLSFVSKIAAFEGINTSDDPSQAKLLTSIEEVQASTQAWLQKWTMVTVIEGQCEDACRKTLFHMGQIRKAMGVNREKVHRVALLSNSLSEDSLHQLLNDYIGTEFVIAPQNNIDRLLTQFSGITPALANGIYLVDPRGSYMMAYAADMPAKYLLDDMERLFKVNK